MEEKLKFEFEQSKHPIESDKNIIDIHVKQGDGDERATLKI